DGPRFFGLQPQGAGDAAAVECNQDSNKLCAGDVIAQRILVVFGRRRPRTLPKTARQILRGCAKQRDQLSDVVGSRDGEGKVDRRRSHGRSHSNRPVALMLIVRRRSMFDSLPNDFSSLLSLRYCSFRELSFILEPLL